MSRRILFVATEDWFFASHFLPMARAAAGLGIEPVVATRLRDHRRIIEAEGVRIIPVQTDRGATGLRAIAAQVAELSRVMRAERPTIVHLVALRSILVGGIAASRAGVRRIVAAPTGLGHFWIETGARAAVGRTVLRHGVRRLRGPLTRYLFENRDDPAALGLAPGDRVTIIGGAGVDPLAFPLQPEPSPGPFRVAYVGRMLRTKGVGTLVEAVRRLQGSGLAVELELWGSPDPANPASIGVDELRAWSALPGIGWRGPSLDVASVWRNAHVGVLLSKREGLPRALVEAMASGRPVVASDVPGCRELVRDGIEGLLVPADDVSAVAGALGRLAGDPELRRLMGDAARRRFEQGFTEQIVMRQVAGVYEGLLPPPFAR